MLYNQYVNYVVHVVYCSWLNVLLVLLFQVSDCSWEESEGESERKPREVKKTKIEVESTDDDSEHEFFAKLEAEAAKLDKMTRVSNRAQTVHMSDSPDEGFCRPSGHFKFFNVLSCFYDTL